MRPRRRTGLFIGVIILIVVNALLLFTKAGEYPASLFRKGALFVLAPLQRTATEVVNFPIFIWQHYFHLISVSDENKNLKRELEKIKVEKEQYTEIIQENNRLKKLLDLKQASSFNMITAQVIGRDVSFWHKGFVINRGKKDGVRSGMPVVVAEGIVGLVVEATNKYARVLLLTDGNIAVDALSQRSRARGLVRGNMSNELTYAYLSFKEDVRKGDQIISSGMDGLFPKGLVIGHIHKIYKGEVDGGFRRVMIMPSVAMNRLEEVFVIFSFPKHMLSADEVLPSTANEMKTGEIP